MIASASFNDSCFWARFWCNNGTWVGNLCPKYLLCRTGKKDIVCPSEECLSVRNGERGGGPKWGPRSPEPFYTMVLRCSRGFRQALNWPPWCRQASAVKLTVVVFPCRSVLWSAEAVWPTKRLLSVLWNLQIVSHSWCWSRLFRGSTEFTEKYFRNRVNPN